MAVDPEKSEKLHEKLVAAAQKAGPNAANVAGALAHDLLINPLAAAGTALVPRNFVEIISPESMSAIDSFASGATGAARTGVENFVEKTGVGEKISTLLNEMLVKLCAYCELSLPRNEAMTGITFDASAFTGLSSDDQAIVAAGIKAAHEDVTSTTGMLAQLSHVAVGSLGFQQPTEEAALDISSTVYSTVYAQKFEQSKDKNAARELAEQASGLTAALDAQGALVYAPAEKPGGMYTAMNTAMQQAAHKQTINVAFALAPAAEARGAAAATQTEVADAADVCQNDVAAQNTPNNAKNSKACASKA
jgi:hypothetical protein